MADKPVRTDKATAVAELTEQLPELVGHRADRVPRPDGRAAHRAAALARADDRRTRSPRTRSPSAPRPTRASTVSTRCSPVLPRSPSSPATPVEAAKGLRDFAKANPLLVIKGGVFEGKAISAAEVTKLADLESREVLLAKLAGAMKANLSKAAAAVPGAAVEGRAPGRRSAGQAREARAVPPERLTPSRSTDF